MTRYLTLLFLMFLTPTARGQVLVVEANAEGTYYVAITVSPSGHVTLRQLDNVARLGTPTPPDGDGDGNGGELDSDLARAIAQQKEKVPEANQDNHGERLALGFRQLRDRIGTAFQPDPDSDAPWQQLANATRQVRRALLGDDHDAWLPVFERMSAEMSWMERAGELSTVEQMRDAYEQIARGLEHSPGEARRRLSPEVRDLILQIIRLILEQFFSVNVEGNNDQGNQLGAGATGAYRGGTTVPVGIPPA